MSVFRMALVRNVLVFLAALLAAALLAGPAQAATFTVNDARDLGDFTAGNGACDADGRAPGNQCTLRAAIEEAGSSDVDPSNLINLPGGTYNLVAGALTPSLTTTIAGAGARTTLINQTTVARAFEISFATVGIRGVTIRGGTANANNGFFGGNLRAQDATVTITDSTITGGNASSGGGLSNVGGSMTVLRSTIAGNNALADGGDGGGIQNTSGRAGGILTVDSSTISGNQARLAGGIISGGLASSSATIRDSTIAGNNATDRLDLPNGGGMSILDGTATVTRSIVANNTSIAATTPNCAADPLGNPPGTITSLGNNLESGTDCGFKAGGDRQSSNPLLGPLANNGGRTDTRALAATSPAVDAAGSSCPPADQRGAARPQGPACDIGAYEAVVAQAAPDTVIVTAPPTVTRDRTPTFTFSASDPGTTFECSIDLGPFVPCTSPFAAPTLAAGTHTFQVRARNSAGNTDPTPASVTFAIPAQLRDLRAPVLGKRVNAEPVSGAVFVAIPAGSGSSRGARTAQKGLRFVPLREAKQIPVGSFFNTRKGRVRLQTATTRRGRRQAAVFDGGLFQTLQSRKRSAKGLFELRLKGSSFTSCRTTGHGSKASAARHSKRKVRRLRGNGKGRFRTRGRHSAATVRGTIWTITDRCDGTLTKVSRGKVAVRDFRRRKNVLLRAGKSYLARARR